MAKQIDVRVIRTIGGNNLGTAGFSGSGHVTAPVDAPREFVAGPLDGWAWNSGDFIEAATDNRGVYVSLSVQYGDASKTYQVRIDFADDTYALIEALKDDGTIYGVEIPPVRVDHVTFTEV